MGEVERERGLWTVMVDNRRVTFRSLAELERVQVPDAARIRVLVERYQREQHKDGCNSAS